MPEETESYWTAVANIVRERPYGPGGAEIRSGTKHFAPGAKVYIIDLFGGMCERIVVVGQHRKSKKLTAIVIDVKLVENLRAKVCYSPAVIEKIKEYCARQYSLSIRQLTQEFAETVCRVVPIWQAEAWRTPTQPPQAPELPNATLQLLRAAENGLTTSAPQVPELASPPAPIPFLAKLWRSVIYLLKD